MKFCVHYMKNRNFKYLNEIDEIEYAYRSDDLNLITVLDSLEGSKRVILRITQIITEDDLRRFGVLEDEYPHLKFAYSLPDFKSESSR